MTIGFNGVVSVTATANSSAGSCAVTAALAGGSNAPVDFELINTTGCGNGSRSPPSPSTAWGMR